MMGVCVCKIDCVQWPPQLIQQKSVEVQRAVEDIIGLAEAFPLGSLAEGQPSVDKEGMLHFREHYCQMMFRAILLATTRSLHALKRRVLSANDPLFEVNVELQRPDYVMNPSLSDVQAAINHAAKIVINCSKHLAVWGFEQEEHLTEQVWAPLHSRQHSLYLQYPELRWIDRRWFR